jgi:uncharacterized protein YndB with AHSA1/START domain
VLDLDDVSLGNLVLFAARADYCVHIHSLKRKNGLFRRAFEDTRGNMPPPYVFKYTDDFEFPLPPERMWGVLEHHERYERWWSWMRELRVEGTPLEPGCVIAFAVVAPIPFKMHLQVQVVEANPPAYLSVRVRGDLEGTGSLRFRADGPGSITTVEWDVEVRQRAMRRSTYVARPLLKWAHDRAVASGVNGFRRGCGG